jgi:hypothetical protein
VIDGPGAARVVVMCDVRAWWMDGVRGKGYKYHLPCDVIDIIDVEAPLTHVSNTIN